MKNGKIYLSIFVIVAVMAGVIFGTQVSKINQDIDKLSFKSVVVKTGEVAGVYQGQGPVTLLINDGSTEKKLEISAQEGESVLDLMKKAQEEENLNFVAEEHDFGVLISEVNGLKGGTEGKYWMYYVNGEMPTVGVDAYETKVGDLVELKFESF